MKVRFLASALVLACTGVVMGGVPALAAASKTKAATPAATSAPAAAATGDAEAEAQKSEHAAYYLKVMISALQSSEIKDDAKSTLVGCLYNASLGEITGVMDKLIAENAEKISRDQPSDILAVMTAVCGYKGNPTQPASTTAPTGR